MRHLIVLVALALACQPNAPDTAALVEGWWHVTLADGTVCLARPYLAPERDTPGEAVAECRASVHIVQGFRTPAVGGRPGDVVV